MSLILAVLYSFILAELASSRAVRASVHTVRNDRFPSDNLHPAQVSANRLRRKVGGYTGPGPLEYLEVIREETNATAVWGLLDRDVVQDNYRPGPNNGKCTLSQSFHFPMKALIKEYSSRSDIKKANNGVIPITRATLRTYIQTIPRHLPEPGDHLIVNVEVLTAIVGQANGITTPSILAAKEPIVVSHNMQENYWLEMSITDGIRNLRVSKSHEECSLMVKVVFNLDVCTKQYRKVPLKVVDPATIPLEDKKRREKHLTVQPMVILYLDEPEVRKQMKQQNKGGHLDEFLIGGGSEKHPSKREAEALQSTTASQSSCHLENITINFHAAGLDNVLSPTQYNVRQCVGSCTISTLEPDNDYISNHGQILASAASLYHQNPSSFEKQPELPCCVPLTYDAAQLLMHDPVLGTIWTQIFPDMAATSCGCR